VSKGNMRIIENKPREKMRQKVHPDHTLRVAAYCRVSTLSEEQELSYETQKDYYTKLISSDPGLELVNVYGDRGCSGVMIEKRPEFKRMMRDCMNGEIDVVMVKSISRFARNLADCLESVRKLKDEGIPVYFEREGLDSMDERCEVLLSMLAAIAQEESNSLSRNIKWAFEKRNEHGRPARRAPYGYRRDHLAQGHNRDEWVIWEPEAKRIRLMFSMAASGSKYREILASLKALEEKEDTGVRWYHDKLYKLLRSEIYQGDVLTNKTYVVDYLSKKQKRNHGERAQYYIEEHHQPIISREVFSKVQALIDARTLIQRKRI